MKDFTKICKLSAGELKCYLGAKLTSIYGISNTIITHDTGYIYAKGTFPVLLVAHLDTVHAKLPRCILHKDDKVWSTEGIGGDDRCGVYMILQIIKRYKCSVLFCDDEEIGGVGAKRFTKDYPSEKFNYIMEFDRMNSSDAIFYDCDNPEFESFITQSYYKTAYGTFSDISIIAPALEVAAVNLSCGYYKAHTVNEYVNMNEMQSSIDAALEILKRTNICTDVYKYIPYKYSSYSYNYYDDGYDSGLYRIEYGYDGETMDEYALSQFEAIGMFLYDNPNLTYNDINRIYLLEDEKSW